MIADASWFGLKSLGGMGDAEENLVPLCRLPDDVLQFGAKKVGRLLACIAKNCLGQEN